LPVGAALSVHGCLIILIYALKWPFLTGVIKVWLLNAVIEVPVRSATAFLFILFNCLLLFLQL
jgi:hypothetical protein